MNFISTHVMLHRSTILIERKSIINVSTCVFQGECEERPPLLPLPGASASGSGHNVPQRAHNTAELATGSVSVLLFRMLLPVAHGHGAECCLPAAAARARRRNCRHRGRLVADQWRDSTIPPGKPKGHPHPSGSILRIRTDRTKEKKRKKKSFRFFKVCGTSSFCTCTASSRPMVGVSQLHYYRSIHLDCTPSLPLCTRLSCFETGREGNPDA